jgi:hypothetical protein
MIAAIRSFKLYPIHLLMALLAAIMGAGAIAGILVFVKGLSLTNLTDLVPWGLWITIDLSSIALSAGAFSLCAAVYLLGLKEYQPIARTATYVGLIGYSMAMLTLLLDICRPDRFWHYLVFWNTHSVLWEVSMCLTLYMIVLALEVAPIIGGRLHSFTLAAYLEAFGEHSSLRPLPGDCGIVPFPAASILAGRHVRRTESPPDLVSARPIDPVYHVGRRGWHIAHDVPHHVVRTAELQDQGQGSAA